MAALIVLGKHLSRTTSFCWLLQLPMEIRVEIYHHLFKSALLSVAPVYPSITHCRYSICSCLFPWHIINTCRQLRQEALEFLLAATTLQISSAASKAKLLPTIFLSSITRTTILNVESYSRSPLDLGAFRSLRVLELHNIAVWCRYHDEDSLSGEGADELMYNLAMFNLKRDSIHLHQLCDSEDRSFRILLYCRYVVSSVKQETLDAVIDVDKQIVLHRKKGSQMTSRNAWAGFY